MKKTSEIVTQNEDPVQWEIQKNIRERGNYKNYKGINKRSQ